MIEICLTAILIILIFTLTIITFSYVFKYEKVITLSGMYDKDILEYYRKNKNNKIRKIINIIISTLFVLIILSLTIVSTVVVRNNGEIFINDKTVVVIGSNSMKEFYNNEYRTEMLSKKQTALNDEFTAGDICIFEKVNDSDELIVNDVYGYVSKENIIIVHRYLGTNSSNKLQFRGDNNPHNDMLVNREQVTLHYIDDKVNYIGNFILFLKSTNGLVFIICTIIIFIISDVYNFKHSKLLEKRYYEIELENSGGTDEKEN